MLFSKSLLLIIAAIAGLASAQSATTASSTATPSGSVKTHVVKVSDDTGALEFFPDSVTATPGDVVQFHFYPRNHSLAQSTFANPCEPIPLTNGTAGFWSGFMPVTTADTTMPVFTVLVRDESPMWFYCATGRHCQNGMAGVINPPLAGNTIAAYKAAAALVANAGIPNTSAGTGGNNNATGGTTPSSTGTATSTATDLPVESSNTNAGSTLVASSVFALIAAGVVAALSF